MNPQARMFEGNGRHHGRRNGNRCPFGSDTRREGAGLHLLGRNLLGRRLELPESIACEMGAPREGAVVPISRSQSG
jgi:hypothetical protein